MPEWWYSKPVVIVSGFAVPVVIAVLLWLAWGQPRL
jgi:hypothetical protein